MTIQNVPASTIVESDPRIQSDSQHGIIGSWWQLAVGGSESACSFVFGVAQDTRSELRRRTDLTINFAEEMGVGSFKFVRKIVDRVDRAANDGMGRSEAMVLVMTRTLRKAGHGVTDLASTTLSDTIGSAGSQRRTDGMRAATA